jgi:pyruvate dehydrogenase E2 component (dihydrolipoamide acetyltransferase)
VGQLIVIEKWAENLDEVTVNEWLVAEGDAFNEGDSLCEIITDKATFEYELDRDAVLVKTYCKAKSVVPLGYVIAFIGEAGETPPEGVEEENAQLLAEHQAKAALDLQLDLDTAPARPAIPERRVRATPAARRVAREAGVDLGAVAEWANDDRVLNETDVQAYIEAQRPGE